MSSPVSLTSTAPSASVVSHESRLTLPVATSAAFSGSSGVSSVAPSCDTFNDTHPKAGSTMITGSLVKNVTSTAEAVREPHWEGTNVVEVVAVVVKSCSWFTSTILSVPGVGAALSVPVYGVVLGV